MENLDEQPKHPSTEDFNELDDQVQEIDNMVADHEDHIADLVSALLEDPALSPDSRLAIRNLHKKIFGNG